MSIPRSLVEISSTPNPYWADEANKAAEKNRDGLTPKQLAKRHRQHSIEPEPI